jgi:colanic acid/amylovoran biosynthesis glycosyltransferase
MNETASENQHTVGSGQVAYLFTTYGQPSETFLRRELAAVRGLGVNVRVISLWGGEDSPEIRRVSLGEMLTLIWKAPAELVRHPDVYRELFEHMLDRDIPSWVDFGENWRGVGCAVLLAKELKRADTRRSHAVWATMPAAAAWVLWKIAKIPYSMGAHAYDVFENGGDWLLPLKLRDATLVHCSTKAARERVIEAGCSPDKIVVIRRGLENMPFAMKPLRTDREKLRIASVGRFVEKKGFRAQIRLYAALAKAGLDFEARLIGSGPLEGEIKALIECYGLGGRVQLTGWLDETGVSRQLEWADAFIFTGRIAKSGDRDGLPNAVAEAMAYGVPIAATPVGAIPEVITSGINGVLIDGMDPEKWLSALKVIQTDDAFCEELRRSARKWVESNFDARRNAATLRAATDERIAMLDS